MKISSKNDSLSNVCVLPLFPIECRWININKKVMIDGINVREEQIITKCRNGLSLTLLHFNVNVVIKSGIENRQKLDGIRVIKGLLIISLFSFKTFRRTFRRG